MALTQKEISARFYRMRKENGLCVNCGEKLEDETHYCKQCKEKHNLYQRETRKFYKSIGICPVCRKEKLFGEEKQCIDCREKSYNRRLKTNVPEEKQEVYKKNFRKKQNELYRERSENGICTRCGKRKTESGKKKCAICLDKDREIHNQRYVKNKKTKQDGICFFCSEPVLDGKTICRKHFEIFSKNGKKNAKNNTMWKNDNKIVFSRF